MLGILFMIIIVSLLYFIFLKYNHRNQYKAFYSTRSPPVIPFLGHIYMFIDKGIFEVVLEIAKYGKSCLVYLPHRTYITTCPEELKVILNHPNAINKSDEYRQLHIALKNTLLLAPAKEWKKNRKQLSKGFQQNILDSFVTTFSEKSSMLVEFIKNKYNEDDIYFLFQKYTLDTFSEATLGINSVVLNEKESKIITCITVGQKLMFDRIGHIFKMNEFLFSFYKESKLIKKMSNLVLDHISNIIHLKRNEFSNEKDVMQNLNRLPVLDLLLEVSDKDNLSDDYIKREMGLFMMAATDTSAHSMSYICCLLGMYPEVQKTIYEEVMECLGVDREITHTDLRMLKYTEMAINEAMRLIPVIPYVGRRTTGDINLGTKIIPNNTGIIVSILGLHRNPEIYPNPTEYDPNRFLPEEVAKRPKYSFLPFSGGPRNCIGKKYSMMLMKTTIANIVRNFIISTKYKSINELEFQASIVLSTTHPLDCHFTPR